MLGSELKQVAKTRGHLQFTSKTIASHQPYHNQKYVVTLCSNIKASKPTNFKMIHPFFLTISFDLFLLILTTQDLTIL